MSDFCLTIRNRILVPGARVALRDVGRIWITLIVVLFSVQQGFAGCGDYLFRNGIAVSDHTMSERVSMFDDASDLASFKSPESLPGPPVSRCHGPNCSRSPVPFAPMPAVPGISLQGSEPAALLEGLIAPTVIRGQIEWPESERGARYLPSSIFRPPAA